MTHADIIKKIIGDVQPAGDASIDPQRFENLKAMCALVDDLVQEISSVARQKTAYQHSIKEMGEYADRFMKNLVDN